LNTPKISRTLLLEPNDSQKLAELCGQFNEHIKLIEQNLDIEILSRGNSFQLKGSELGVLAAETLLKKLYHYCFRAESLKPDKALSPEIVHLYLQENLQENFMENNENAENSHAPKTSIIIETPRKHIESRGENQRAYLERIEKNDINFGIGPAGTGKTYLAVACAVAALKQERVNRIVLVRPAVEAGEKLGFLPGDLNEKVNPYLRPLYDALYEMLGFENVDKMLEKQVIEVAPLAYMRGRTLNNAFIILDESQNTTREQMKMFLTRIGFGSKAVITGDITQIDLPKGSDSGLIHAKQILDKVNGIGFSHFTSKDVVRHRLVQRIIEAYSEHEKNSTIEAISNKRNEHSNTTS
jgi:phosphate starvation-inducible PhoH-like protein